MRRREEGIKLQKKVHRIIYVRGITFLAAGHPYVIFCHFFRLLPTPLSSTSILREKNQFAPAIPHPQSNITNIYFLLGVINIYANYFSRLQTTVWDNPDVIQAKIYFLNFSNEILNFRNVSELTSSLADVFPVTGGGKVLIFQNGRRMRFSLVNIQYSMQDLKAKLRQWSFRYLQDLIIGKLIQAF